MRTAALTLLTLVAAAMGAASQTSSSPAPPSAQAPAPRAVAPSAPLAPASRPVGTMSELMVHVIRPASDAVFYITSRTPTTDAEWGVLQAQTLMLAESGHLLLMPSRARARAQWIADSQLMLEAGRKAFAAAKAKDVAALEALNDEMYQSCVVCHEHFRPGYGKRP